MKIGILMDVPGANQAHYDAVMQNLGLPIGSMEGNWPEGLISHIAAPIPTGWRVIDVWESREHFQKFFESRLGPAVQKAQMPAFQPQFFDLYNVYVAHMH